MSSLYELNEQMLALDSLLSENTDPETHEILESAKEQLMADIDNKCENILGYISECKAKAEYYKNEIERLAGKKKVLENRVDWLKKLIFGHLQATGRTKADYGSWTVSIGRSPDRVVVFDDKVDLIPEAFCRIKREPNKTAIKDNMENGEFYIFVNGQKVLVATLETGNQTLRIK